MKAYNNDVSTMINGLIRSSNVIDQKVITVFENILRNDFVPDKYKKFSSTDYPIPIKHNQKMLLPSIEGKILQNLSLKGNENVLVVGAGTGYLTCCLSKLCNQVHSIDIFGDLIEKAENNISNYSEISNITFEKLDIKTKWDILESYDVIVFTSYIENEKILSENLGNNSKVFLFVGSADNPVKEGILIEKFKNDSLIKNILFETDADPLI